MLKAKNILIIFIVNYLIMLLICSLIELISVSNTAEQVQIMMRTAADMALEQVQATDDFFTTGGGYILSNDSYQAVDRAYKAKVLGTDGTYKDVNIFEALTGKKDMTLIYNSVYSPEKIAKYIDENPSVLSVDFSVGQTTQFVYSGDLVTDINSSYKEGNVSSEAGTGLVMTWYKVPTLAQLGSDGTLGRADKLYTKEGNEIITVAGRNVKDDIFKMYSLKEGKKTAKINGKDITYYLTPLSLGVTYINEDLLQAFFMNNLELLMRSKYTQRSDYNLNSENCGNGVLKTAFYPELVDEDSLEHLNPINNGVFTLLRGNKMSGTESGIEIYEGIKPKVEYLVIDMYDDKYNDILQLILGAKTTSNSGVENGLRGKTITGSLLKSMNAQSINAMETLTGDIVTFKHKAIVVAKVSFYADFIVPYTTVSLREMRGRVVDNTIGGRGLFNPFVYSTINENDVSALSENYVDVRHKTIFDNLGEYASKIYETKTGFTSNSDALVYTTYFAVTP